MKNEMTKNSCESWPEFNLGQRVPGVIKIMRGVINKTYLK